MLTRSERARQIARSIALRTFRGNPGLNTLLCDAESVAFELELSARPNVTAASIAFMAVRRVRVGRQFKESIRSLNTGRFERRSKRPKFTQIDICLTSLAAPDHNPADVAAFKIDFAQWLATWKGKKRAVLVALAVGNATSEVAAQFNISPSRVSQLRREYEDSWRALEQQSEN